MAGLSGIPPDGALEEAPGLTARIIPLGAGVDAGSLSGAQAVVGAVEGALDSGGAVRTSPAAVGSHPQGSEPAPRRTIRYSTTWQRPVAEGGTIEPSTHHSGTYKTCWKWRYGLCNRVGNCKFEHRFLDANAILSPLQESEVGRNDVKLDGKITILWHTAVAALAQRCS